MTGLDEDAVRPLARHDGEPVFDELWQARALALTFSLTERGFFTPAQWSQALGTQHRRLLTQGAPDTPQTYYEAVTGALERLVHEHGICPGDEVENRAEAWRRAYLNTPHGAPVELTAGNSKPE